MRQLTFFADHCIPSSIMTTLTEAGYVVLRLRDYIPTDSPDEDVIACAQKESAVLLTFNGDFADIVTYPPSEYTGIIALQVRNHPEILPDLMDRFLAFLSSHGDMEYYEGKLFLVEVHRIRIRQ